MPDLGKKLLERFWVLRGVATAMSVAELVPKFTSIERFEFLRAFHALLVQWNHIAAWLGRLVGYLPFLPSLSVDVVNAIVFASSFGIPSGYYLMYKDPYTLRKEEEYGESPESAKRLIVAFITGLFFCIYIWIIAIRLDFLTGSYFSAAFFSISTLLILRAVFLPALLNMEGYKRGFVYTLTFIATLQCCYWLNTPWLKAEINRLADEGLTQTTN